MKSGISTSSSKTLAIENIPRPKVTARGVGDALFKGLSQKNIKKNFKIFRILRKIPRILPILLYTNDPLAQKAEYVTLNHDVRSSNLRRVTNIIADISAEKENLPWQAFHQLRVSVIIIVFEGASAACGTSRPSKL